MDWGASASGSKKIGSPGPGSRPNVSTKRRRCSRSASIASGGSLIVRPRFLLRFPIVPPRSQDTKRTASLSLGHRAQV
jgi:hypothetical protein